MHTMLCKLHVFSVFLAKMFVRFTWVNIFHLQNIKLLFQFFQLTIIIFDVLDSELLILPLPLSNNFIFPQYFYGYSRKPYKSFKRMITIYFIKSTQKIPHVNKKALLAGLGMSRTNQTCYICDLLKQPLMLTFFKISEGFVDTITAAGKEKGL